MKFLRLIVLFLFGSLCAKSQGFIANEGQLYDQYNRPVEDVLFTNQVSSNCHLQLRQNGYSYETFETITTATNSIKNKIEPFYYILSRGTKPSKRNPFPKTVVLTFLKSAIFSFKCTSYEGKLSS